MLDYLIKNVRCINEGQDFRTDLSIKNGRIQEISPSIEKPSKKEINGEGLILIPGMIDDQVHFREPGLTHKAEIYTESRAAAAGGITTFMEMPNTVPNALTIELLEDKYRIAAKNSQVNYSFYLGASNDNLDEIKKMDRSSICGVKIFMGSSTGDMLVDKERALNGIFREAGTIITTHCEKEEIIRENTQKAIEIYGDDIPIEEHPIIRSREACYASSSQAIELARKNNSDLHILHISTKEELDLFDNTVPLEEKKITAEACTHHLWFTDKDYVEKGAFIKWNPAVKSLEDREVIRAAISSNKIDVLATDHAPHTIEEKSNKYLKAPSGGPLVQHALLAFLDMVDEGVFDLKTLVTKSSHNVATRFKVKERGFIREGYWADLVLIDPNSSKVVSKNNLLYKCGWSPFEGHEFKNSIKHTFSSGQLVYSDGKLKEPSAKRIEINR